MSMLMNINLFFAPQTHSISAKVVTLAAQKWLNFLLTPIYGQFTKTIHKPFFFHHGQMSFTALFFTAVVISHSPTHFFIGHFFISIGLHESPGPGKVRGRIHFENALCLGDPGHYSRIVATVMQEVSNEDV